MVPPMERKNCRLAVTWPNWRKGKAFWTTMVKRLIVVPMPSPRMTIFWITVASVLVTPMRESRKVPAAATAKANRASGLYWPVRDIIWPPTMLLTMKPSIIGVVTAPEFVALLPSTPWTKSGRYMIAPNIPTATMKVVITETVKMLFLKKLGLMIGSAAAVAEARVRRHEDF